MPGESANFLWTRNAQEGKTGEALDVEEVRQGEQRFPRGTPKRLSCFHWEKKTRAVRAPEGARLESFQGFFHLA